MQPRPLREWVWETKHALVLDTGMVLDTLRLVSTVGRAANTCDRAPKRQESAEAHSGCPIA
jgi:hypothetical protein